MGISTSLDANGMKNRALRHDRLYLGRHPGEGRDLDGASKRHGEIPAFAGMTDSD